MTAVNRKITLARVPVGIPGPQDFAFVDETLRPLEPGEVRVRMQLLGLEPSARPRMNPTSPYSQPIGIGGVISSTGIGIVMESRGQHLREGDAVFVHSGWQEIFTCPEDAARLIDFGKAPAPKWLSLLGLSSFTAYIGVTELGRPAQGETFVVSAASGATGAVAGQIARILGARAIGIASGPEKCRYVVDELGFDHCIDRKAQDFEQQLDAACPNGIDVDYENVGGSVFEAIFARMNRYGRVILCGLISEYSEGVAPPGPNLWPAVYKALRIEGFLASRYWDRIPEFVDRALAWHEAGLLRHTEHIVDGFENTPDAFRDLLQGRHCGKMIVRIGDGPSSSGEPSASRG